MKDGFVCPFAPGAHKPVFCLEADGMEKRIPRPERVRVIPRSFGWVDHRLLRNRFLERMTSRDMALYLFLVLAADKDGVSWYRLEKICSILGFTFEQFYHCRHRLERLGLVAFEPFSPNEYSGFHQVLTLDGLVLAGDEFLDR